MPIHLKERKKRSLERMAFVLGATIFVGILAFSYFWCLAKMTIARERAAVAVREYESLAPQLQQLKNGLLLKKIVRTRPDMGGLLKQISYMPPQAYLTELNFKSGKVYMAGFVTGSDKESREIPAQLVSELKKGIMADAKLLPAKNKVPGKAAPLFEIEGRMGSAGGAR